MREINGHLVHPCTEWSSPGVLLLQMEVCVEQDEVNVAFKVLETFQLQNLRLLFCLCSFDLRKKINKKNAVDFMNCLYYLTVP